MTGKTPAIYGAAPKNLGFMDFDTSEMMFWLYCPIKLGGWGHYILPPNLEKFDNLIRAVFLDTCRDEDNVWRRSYVYLSAKTLFVSPGSPGNRPGWHSDGFLTNDLNYIWSDLNPTLFFETQKPLSFTADHSKALAEMAEVCNMPVASEGEAVVTYPDKHLLRLDQTVLHAVNPAVIPGVRTFLKVSVSETPYALQGNSINHEINHPSPNGSRHTDRNCPRGM